MRHDMICRPQQPLGIQRAQERINNAYNNGLTDGRLGKSATPQTYATPAEADAYKRGYREGKAAYDNATN